MSLEKRHYHQTYSFISNRQLKVAYVLPANRAMHVSMHQDLSAVHINAHRCSRHFAFRLSTAPGSRGRAIPISPAPQDGQLCPVPTKDPLCPSVKINLASQHAWFFPLEGDHSSLFLPRGTVHPARGLRFALQSSGDSLTCLSW